MSNASIVAPLVFAKVLGWPKRTLVEPGELTYAPFASVAEAHAYLKSHEAEIHMHVLVAMEESGAGIVGDEIDSSS